MQKYDAATIDRAEYCKPKKYDAVFIVNGIGLYCNFKEELVRLCEANDRFLWIGNDHAINMMSQIRFITDKEFYLVAHYENFKKYANYIHINWNQLTFKSNRPLQSKQHVGLSYYGAFRKDRAPYFAKYLKTDVPYEVFIATSPKNRANFYSFCHKAKFFTVKNIIYNYGVFSDTIYIEDVKNHVLETCPANRFYECLSAGVYQHFDRSCVGTFERVGIDISDFIVDSADDIVINDPKRLKQQRHKLYDGKDYCGELDAAVDARLTPILRG